MPNKRHLLFSLLFFICNSLIAQENYFFRHLNIENGLSQSSVFGQMQDSKGFMWFCTEDGLNKYDGYTFMIFKDRDRKTNKPLNNNFNSIAEEKDGIFWVIKNYEGVIKFDSKTNHFFDEPDNPLFRKVNKPSLVKVEKDPKGNIWFLMSGDGSYCLHPSGVFDFLPYPTGYQRSTVNDVLMDENGQLWFFSNKGIFRLEDGEMKLYQNPELPTNLDVICATLDLLGNIWLGSPASGAYVLQKNTEKVRHYSADGPTGISGNRVVSLCTDLNGNVWISTAENGISVYNIIEQNFTHFRHKPGDYFGIHSNKIYNTYADKNGNVWIATPVGIDYTNTHKKSFSNLKVNEQQLNSYNGSSIGAIWIDPQGRYWLGSKSDGLFVIDKQQNKFSLFKTSNSPNSILSNTIYSICPDSKGNVWVGCDLGICIINPNNFQISKEINQEIFKDKPVAVRVVFRDSDNNMWLGTSGAGAIKIKPDGTIVLYKSDRLIGNKIPSITTNAIRCIYEDKFNTLWVGTQNGVHKYDKTNDLFDFVQITEDETFSRNLKVRSIHFEPPYLYIGSITGFFKSLPEKHISQSFTEENGLPNNVVYSILPDEKSNLWLSTNNGLSRFSIKDEQFMNFDISDGLQSNEFNSGSAFKSNDGSLFFGGVNGVSFFHPKDIAISYKNPIPVITSLRVFDKEKYFDSLVNRKGVIHLNYDQNFFSIEFAALTFNNQENLNYQYQLEGFDKGWQNAGKRRYVSYTNLPGGDYVFKVRTSNNKSILNEGSYQTLNIHITTAPWNSWWFRTLVIFSAAFLIYFFLNKRNKAKLEEAELRSIKKSEDKFKELVQNAADMIFILDEKNSVKYISPAVTKITGYSLSDLEGYSLLTFTHPEDVPEVKKTIQQRKENPEYLAPKEWRLKDRKGRYLYLESIGRDLSDNPNINGYLINARDITERKIAEKEIEANEQRFKGLAQNSSDIICLLNEKGKILYVSPASKRILGFEESEMEGKNMIDFIHPEDRTKTMRAFLRRKTNPDAERPISYRMKNKKGNWLYIESIGSNQLNNQVIGGIIINSRDVTERILAEHELQQSEQKLSLHFHQTEVGIIEWDNNARISEWNPGAEKIFGFTKEEAIGKGAELILKPNLMPQISQVFRDLYQMRGGTHSANENITKSGKTISCEWFNTPLVGGDGKVVGIASVVFDITQRVKSEEQLRSAKEAAEHATRMKSEFLANMSHEIRTPLNGIMGLTEITLRSPLNVEQRENLTMVKESADSLLAIINDILDFSKIEAGKLEFENISFNLRELISRTTSLYLHQIDEKSLNFNVHFGEDLPNQLKGDPKRLQQILINLLTNSLKFTEQGSIQLRVEKQRLVGEDVILLFQVLDTGIGITPEKQQIIFNSFTQADGSYTRKYGGTGLGLSICANLVEMMKGSIWVESTPGVGSCFSFTAQFEIDKNLNKIEKMETVSPLPELHFKPKILLAEDTILNQKLIEKILKNKDMELFIVNNGLSVIEEWKKNKYDLILMDIFMPILDGLEASRRIREMEKETNSHIPIIAMTALATTGDRQNCLEAGMDDYISKPIKDNELYFMIYNLLKHQNA